MLTNDQGPGPLTAGPANIATTDGGTVTMNPRWHVRLPAGAVERPITNDTFTYTLTDGNTITNTATVTIPIGDVVWYVDSGGAHGLGTSHSPFQHLNAATTSSTVNHDVFVYGGGPPTVGDITLEAGQTLHGHGSTYTNGGLTIPAGSHPVLSDSVHLASNVTVNSLTLSSGGDSAIVGTNAVTGTVNINSVNVTGGATGLHLTNVPATVNVVGGAFSGVSGAEVRVDQGAGHVNIGATITNTAGRSIHVTNHTGNLTISAAVNDTGQGIFLDNNDGSTMTFSGGLTLSTGASVAFTHSNGGSSIVSGANNTITTSGATAIELKGTTIEHQAGAHTWRTISAASAAKGISVQYHDSPFTVTGTDGGDGDTLADPASGGTISNITNRGAEFIRVTGAVSLGGVTFTNTGTTNGAASTACGSPQTGTPQNCAAAIHLEHTSAGVNLTTILANGGNQIGINGTHVHNLVMQDIEVANFGNEVDEHGVQLHNLTGTGSLTNGNFHDNESRQFYISNGSGTLSAFNISLKHVRGQFGRRDRVAGVADRNVQQRHVRERVGDDVDVPRQLQRGLAGAGEFEFDADRQRQQLGHDQQRERRGRPGFERRHAEHDGREQRHRDRRVLGERRDGGQDGRRQLDDRRHPQQSHRQCGGRVRWCVRRRL